MSNEADTDQDSVSPKVGGNEQKTWLDKAGKKARSVSKSTKQIAKNAAERVTVSTQKGAAAKSPNNNSSSSESSSSMSAGQIIGGIGGAMAGLGRAAIGIPKDIARGKSKQSFEQGFALWGPRELRALQGEPATEILAKHQLSVRIVALRHGHAAHNDMGGLTSVASRDAGLTVLGKEEAVVCGQILQGMQFDMVVVSPYRRCLETAALILNDRAAEIEHIVEPRAGEHNGGTFKNKNMCAVRAQVSRGDLGSEKADLLARFPSSSYPQYAAGLQQLPPRWWEHGQQGGFETQESFAQRALDLRCWLGSLAPMLWERWEGKVSLGVARQPTILLVAHGGILCAAFETKLHPENASVRPNGKFQNCEFRVFDVCPGGFFKRPQLTPTYTTEGSVVPSTTKPHTSSELAMTTLPKIPQPKQEQADAPATSVEHDDLWSNV